MVVDIGPMQGMPLMNGEGPPPPRSGPELDEKVRKKIRSTLTASGSGGCSLNEFVVNLRKDWHVDAEQVARDAGFSGVVAMLRAMRGDVQCRMDRDRIMVRVVVSEEIEYNMRHIDESIKDKEKHKKIQKARARAAPRPMARRTAPPPRHPQPLPIMVRQHQHQLPPPHLLHMFNYMPPPPMLPGFHPLVAAQLPEETRALLAATLESNYPHLATPPPAAPAQPDPFSSRPPPPSFKSSGARKAGVSAAGIVSASNLEPIALRPEFADRFGAAATSMNPAVNQRAIPNGDGKAGPASRRGGTGGNSVPLANNQTRINNMKPALNQLSPSIVNGNRYEQMMFDAVNGSPYQYGENEVEFGKNFPAGRGQYSACQHAYSAKLPRKQSMINSMRDRGRPAPKYENLNPPMHSIRSPPPSLAHFDFDVSSTEAFPTDDGGSSPEIDVAARPQDELKCGDAKKRCSQRTTTSTLDEWECIPLLSTSGQSIQTPVSAIPAKLHRIVHLLREADGHRLQMKKLEEAYKKRYGCALNKSELIDCLGAKGANNSAAAFQKCAVPNLFNYKMGVMAVIELKENIAAGEGSSSGAQSGVKSQYCPATSANSIRLPTYATALNSSNPALNASPVTPNIRSLLRSASRLSVGSTVTSRRDGSQSTVHDESAIPQKVDPPPPDSVPEAPICDRSPSPSTSIAEPRAVTPPCDSGTISRAPSVAGTVTSSMSFASTAPIEEHFYHLMELVSYVYNLFEPGEWMTLSALYTNLTNKYLAPVKEKRSLLRSKQQVAGLLATHFESCFKLQARKDGEILITKVPSKRPEELVEQLQCIHPINFRLVEEVLVAGACYSVTIVKLLSDGSSNGPNLHFTFQLSSRNFIDAQLDEHLSSLVGTLEVGGNLLPTLNRPILYLTERSRLLRCWVTNANLEEIQLECIDSGEKIASPDLMRMFEFPKELEGFPVAVSHAEFDLSSCGVPSPQKREELARALREMIRAKHLMKLEVLKKSNRTPLSKLYTVRLHPKSLQKTTGTIDIYPDSVLMRE